MAVNFGSYSGHELLEKSGRSSADRLIDAFTTKKKMDQDKEQFDIKAKADAKRDALAEADSSAVSSGFRHEVNYIDPVVDAKGKVTTAGYWDVTETTDQYEPYKRADEKFQIEQSGKWDHDNDPTTDDVSTLAGMNQEALLTGSYTDADGNVQETYAKKSGDRSFESEFAEKQYNRLSENAQMGDIVDSDGNIIVKDYKPESYNERIKEESYTKADNWVSETVSGYIKDGNYDDLSKMIYDGGIEEWAATEGIELGSDQLQTLENVVYNNVEKALKKIDQKYNGKSKEYIKNNLTDAEKSSYQDLYSLKNNLSIPNVAEFIHGKTVKGTDYADTYGYTDEDMNWAKDMVGDGSSAYQENIVGNNSIWQDPDFYLKGSGWDDNDENDTMLVAAMKSRLESIYAKDSGLSDTWIKKDGGNYYLVEDDPFGDDNVQIKMGADGPMVKLNGKWVDMDENIQNLVDEF